MASTAPQLSLRFVDQTQPEKHAVDSAVLAEALVHGQRALHLLAMMASGRELKERLRIPADIASEFKLVCAIPTEGSYAQAVELRGTGAVLDVPSREGVLDTFVRAGSALSSGDWERLSELIPDTAVRHRLIDEYRALLPDPESGYGMDLSRGQVHYARFRRPEIMAVHEYSRRLREPEDSTTAPVRIVGELVSIDFGSRTITIRHYPTNRRVTCEYMDEAEEMLVENRRGLLQVTGVVELDRRDRPVRMTKVFQIQEVDLSPFALSVIEGESLTLRFRDKPYQVSASLDPDGQLLVAEDKGLDLHVFASTRAELSVEIAEHIEFLWLEYVETDEELTAGAAELRSRLHRLLEPVDDA